VLTFNKPPLALAVIVYAMLAIFFAQTVGKLAWERVSILALGTAAGIALRTLPPPLLNTVLGGLYILLAAVILVTKRKALIAILPAVMGIYLMSYNWAEAIAAPIALFSRGMERGFWSNAIFQLSDHIKVLFQPPPAFMAVILIFLGIILLQGLQGRGVRLGLGILGLAIPCALSFTGTPFALVGGAYIIMAAYVVRSIPASVRAGVASLQQIDPSIEEASNILGADAQYTFRKVTLPLILPALIAGLIFSFTRHMTSLSAIIFLVSARWRIVTASILSEWEQGGVSIAAAYSTVIILFVIIAIGVLSLVTNRLFRGRGGVDISQNL
jgi:iron(III) transport system permease protein